MANGLILRNDDRRAILVVDDDPRMQRLLRANLERAGYRVDTAGEGAGALERVELAPPDLILLDVMMPVMDGLTLLARLREFSDVPVIMLTAKGEEQDKVRPLDGGADDTSPSPSARRSCSPACAPSCAARSVAPGPRPRLPRSRSATSPLTWRGDGSCGRGGRSA